MTGIQWTDVTWNPTTGCDQVSPGCDNCYALTLSKRLKAMGQPKYQNDGNPRTSGPGFGLTVHPDTLDTPRKWKKPRMVFVNSMSDLFHGDVPLRFIQDTFRTMMETPQHTYQVLTKRSHRLQRVAEQLDWPANLWIGVSVENASYRFRLRHLSTVEQAPVRFVSVEPLIGAVGELDLVGNNIDWVIVGGESGPNHRPIKAEWVRDIRYQCAAADVPFFFKQWGGRTAKANGRLLDGILHHDFPA